MLCFTCNTLLHSYNERNCIKCKNKTLINIAILCDSCSDKDGICAACLKKTNLSINKNKISGCRCGSK